MTATAARWARKVGLTAAVLLSLAACPALADDPLSVILARRTPPLMNALNLVAQGAGFYREEHLRVTTRLTDQAIQTLRSCASGQSDICPMPIEPMLEHFDDGVRMKMFLSSADTFTVVIAVPADSPVRTLADLKGKAIGVHLATGAAGVFPTQSALAAAGVKPGETTMVTVGMNQQAMDALASGQVAALGLPMYEMVPFIAAGAELRIFRHPILGHIANGGYASAPSVIAAKSDVLGPFLPRHRQGLPADPVQSHGRRARVPPSQGRSVHRGGPGAHRRRSHRLGRRPAGVRPDCRQDRRGQARGGRALHPPPDGRRGDEARDPGVAVRHGPVRRGGERFRPSGV